MLGEATRVPAIAVDRVLIFAWVIWASVPTVWCEEGQVRDACAMVYITEEEP